jgi:3-methyladenine DNA glycosylase AlkD
MQATDILKELESLGAESYRKVLRNHGVNEPMFGVKISELKKIQKRLGKVYELALELFDTGNYDAQYLAGLVVDDKKMTQRDLKKWLKSANCRAISAYPVAWVAAESHHGHKLGLDWIESKQELTAATGWATLASWISITPDQELDFTELTNLLERISKTIHQQPDHASSGIWSPYEMRTGLPARSRKVWR